MNLNKSTLPCQHPDDPTRFGVLVPRELLQSWGFWWLENARGRLPAGKGRRIETLANQTCEIEIDPRLIQYLQSQEFDPFKALETIGTPEGVMYFYA